MRNKDKNTKVIRLQLVAGKATPAPPAGPVLGSAGVNIVAFCKAFNDRTRHLGEIPVTAVIYVDVKKKDFRFDLKQPPVSALIKKALKIENGSKTPNREKVGKLTMEMVKQIASSKMEDLVANSIEAACMMVIGTAKSMGVEIVD